MFYLFKQLPGELAIRHGRGHAFLCDALNALQNLPPNSEVRDGGNHMVALRTKSSVVTLKDFGVTS